MPKTSHGFTLLEVLVAVMIIAVVIGSLIQLFANNSNTFASIPQRILHTNTTSLLLGNKVYGFQKAKTDMAELVKDFKIDDDLRRKLKDIKAEIIYSEVTTIDFGAASESIAEEASSKTGSETLVKDVADISNAIEIGRTTLKIKDQSSSFVRIKFQ
jgi:prepilin-type N-terminal cleavage/methylation domain-containing protein